VLSETAAAVDFLFGYTGRERDKETGLWYLRARYYGAPVGRFLSEDPISFRARDPNLYRYVGNSPTNVTDPSGLQPPRGTARDIINDLYKDGNAGMRRGLEARRDSFCPGIEAAQDGQRMMADIAGFGPAVDAGEAISGKDVFSGKQLTFWQRMKAALWSAASILPFIDSVDDGARTGARTGSRVDDTVDVAETSRTNIRSTTPSPALPGSPGRALTQETTLGHGMTAGRSAGDMWPRQCTAPKGTLNGRSVWGRADTLDDHFRRHGGDFGGSSADDYAQKAADFFQDAQRRGLPTKVDADGVVRVYDPATNTFGAYNPNGTTRTFYKPRRGIDYWNDQPGSAPWIPGQ
jgi:RHS repeat-associated protein